MPSVKVSLCITVYNREKTIKRCLESAVKQTMQDFEIIVIDDCSNDNTVKIIQEYQKKYFQIIFLQNNVNRGAGYTKNQCVLNARGNFISFLDSDDYIPPDYLEKMYSAIVKTGSDIAVADLCKVYKGIPCICPILNHNLFLMVNNLIISSSSFPFIIPNICIAAFWGGASACTKMAKKELWEMFPFYEGRRGDDLPAVLPMVAIAKKIAYIPQCRYYYVQNKNSIERTKSLKKYIDATEAIVATFYQYKILDIDSRYQQLLCATSIFPILQDIFFYPQRTERSICIKQVYKKLLPITKSGYLDYKNNPYLEFQMNGWKKKFILPLFRLFSEGRISELIVLLEKWKWICFLKHA